MLALQDHPPLATPRSQRLFPPQHQGNADLGFSQRFSLSDDIQFLAALFAALSCRLLSPQGFLCPLSLDGHKTLFPSVAPTVWNSFGLPH